MEKPKSLHEAIQRLEEFANTNDSLQSRFDQQSADLEAATALNEENQNQVNQLSSDLEATRAENKTLKAQNSDLVSKLSASEAREGDLQKQLQGEERRAAGICAGVGVDPVNVTNNETPGAMNKEELQAHLNALSGSERHEFWRKNRNKFYGK